MEPAIWNQIKEAYTQAKGIPLAELDHFIRELPPEIEADVRALLAADRDAGAFIEQPYLIESGRFVPDVNDDLTGREIGEYRLIEKIGSGGMGTVYLAEHEGEGFSKRVALKFIKRGMDTSAVLKRFILERQILANLEHPNIARMLDGGSTGDGLPYFVMEYVEGEPITRYCDRHGLDARGRIELFIDVCSAVSYAHQKLVVHRDLKPSNILVTDNAEPKLLDFGIGKLLSPDRLSDSETVTATQFRVLTPEYASPEQIRGEPTTTATDVFSLGVVLYELLTGVRPFRNVSTSASFPVTGEEPKKPSLAVLFDHRATSDAKATARGDHRLTGGESASPATQRSVPDPRTLRGDLDNIVLKALRNEPERRYRSVQELIEDLDRYLTGMPVKATADTMTYRVGKFVKRHRAGLAATAFAGFLLTGTTSVAVWQAVKADRERATADARSADIRRLANSLVFDVHDSIRDLPGSTPARREIVARALEYLDKLAKEGPKEMSLQLELATGLERVGDVQGNPLGPNLGETDAAITSYAKALDIRESIFDELSDDERYKTALLHSKLFRTFQIGGKWAEAEQHCTRATSILDGLTCSDRSNPLYSVTAARFHLELGDMQQTREPADFDSAVANYEAAISLCRSIVSTEEADTKGRDGMSLNDKIHDVLQMVYRRLGERYESQNDNARALVAFRDALTESEALLSSIGPQKAQVELVFAIALANVGRLEAVTGSGVKGLANVNRSIEILRKAASGDSKNYLAASQLGLAYWNSGTVHSILDDPSAAMADFQRALNIQTALKKGNENDPYNLANLADTYASIAGVHEKAKRLSESRSAYQKSFDLWNSMKDAGTLPGYYAHKPRQLQDSIQRVSGI